jgi:peptide-methionine (S)-S-oxide reductase
MSFRKTLLTLCAGCAIGLAAVNVPPPSVDLPSPGDGKVATAVLSGGCFWGVEAVFERLKGVIACDPSQISYGKPLQIFFAVAHGPTRITRQGPDVGAQYRSVIFYSTDAQKNVAKAYIAQIGRSHVFRDAIATGVSLLPGFFPAEDHHRHYLQRNPLDPCIVPNDWPRLRALEEQFPGLLNRH